MHDARTVLAEMLSQLDAPGGNSMLRLQAAAMANRLALFHSDPSLTDVAESLLLDCEDPVPSNVREGLKNESAVARATRRAIALSHRQKLRVTKECAMGLAADPSVLLREAKEQMAMGDNEMAQTTLDVARARHPNDPALSAAQERLQNRLDTGDGGQDNPRPTG